MAKVISNNLELKNTFKDCCNKYQFIEFIIAWAGRHETSKVLLSNSHKIRNSVVGLHFYQTSPQFIKDFVGTTQLQYIKRMTTDVFHPKVYLFYNNSSEWSAIVGSSNFTAGGFERNIECNVLMTSETESDEVFQSLKELIIVSWKKSEPMGNFFEEYCERHKEAKNRIPFLKKPLNSSIKDISWQDYLDKMKRNEGENDSLESDKIKTRIKMLKRANELLSKSSLYDLPDKYPWAIAGLISEYGGIKDWFYFGSLIVNGSFYKLFNTDQGRKQISDALDIIPITGEVTKEQFQSYLEQMRKATKQNDIKAISTRFLAIKRPDTFVCVNSKNTDLLELLATNRKTLKIDQYWDLIIENIRLSEWYNDSYGASGSALERDIFNFRVAMLDALYYRDSD